MLRDWWKSIGRATVAMPLYGVLQIVVEVLHFAGIGHRNLSRRIVDASFHCGCGLFYVVWVGSTENAFRKRNAILVVKVKQRVSEFLKRR